MLRRDATIVAGLLKARWKCRCRRATKTTLFTSSNFTKRLTIKSNGTQIKLGYPLERGVCYCFSLFCCFCFCSLVVSRRWRRLADRPLGIVRTLRTICALCARAIHIFCDLLTITSNKFLLRTALQYGEASSAQIPARAQLHYSQRPT